MNVSGYACPDYAESLTEFGTARILPQSEGWILERPTPLLAYTDAMGCYPLFKCGDWSKLRQDIDGIGDSLVSLSMLPDPFGDYDEAYLQECFKDRVLPFKQHYIADMHRPVEDIVSRHHRKYARKAQKQIRTEICLEPESFLDEWMALHRNLVARHDITGIRAYSRRAFEKQLRIPGIVVMRALQGNETVGAQLWFQHDNVAFGHVLAFNEAGYRLGAPYALYWFALNYFVGKVKWCDLGGIPGMNEGEGGDLRRFKQGWSSDRITAYFCGRILNRDRYAELVDRQRNSSDLFPAYRRTF